MVRLVFRPYTQIRRTICTSVSLRASTRVSPGFALFRHRSPSFGSQQICSYSGQTPKDLIRSIVPPCGFLPQVQAPFTFITPMGFKHPKTRTYVRLLGPCFKTGQIRLFRHDRETADHVKHCTLVDTATHTVCYSATSSKPPNATIAAYQSSISVALGLGASFEDRTLVFSRNTNRP